MDFHRIREDDGRCATKKHINSAYRGGDEEHITRYSPPGGVSGTS